MRKSSEADAIYEGFATGETQGPVPEDLQARFLQRVRKRSLSWDPAIRLRSLRAAAALGVPGLRVAEQLKRDASITLRTAALRMAISANKEGLRTLRLYAEDAAPEIALEALRRLCAAGDKGSSPVAARLLSAEDDDVRCAAAKLLGQVGGRSAVSKVRVARDKEASEAVRTALDDALARLDGSAERPAPAPWWTSDTPPSTLEVPPADLVIEDAPTEPPPPNPAQRLPPYLEKKLHKQGKLPYTLPPDALAKLEASMAKTSKAPAGANAPQPAAPPPSNPPPTPPKGEKKEATLAESGSKAGPPPTPSQSSAVLAPSSPADGPKATKKTQRKSEKATKTSASEGTEGATKDAASEPPQLPAESERALPVPLPPLPDDLLGGSWAALPAHLPIETRARVKLLGMIGPDDRGVIVSLLRDHASAVTQLLTSYRGQDAALGRGLALAAMGLSQEKWLRQIQRLFTDDAPIVRAGAVEAVGALGKASAIPQVARLLSDSDPHVRMEVARALVSIGVRTKRQTLVRPHLATLERDADADVKTLAKTLKGDLDQ